MQIADMASHSPNLRLHKGESVMFETTIRCQAGIVESNSVAQWTARIGGGLLLATSFAVSAAPVPVPEILHYKFDEAGTSVTNHASAPPPGTETGLILGSLVQGGSFSAIAGELTGTGQSSSSDYVITNWVTNLPGSWTISFFTSAVVSPFTRAMVCFNCSALLASLEVVAASFAARSAIIFP
jgi:hypothetical protein